MRKVWSVGSFLGAFLFGISAWTLAGWLIDCGTAEKTSVPERWGGTVNVSYVLREPVVEDDVVPLRASDLAGVWRGSWGHASDACTIEIRRVDGTRFHGTLWDQGAVISIEGYIDPAERRVQFMETKVVRLGPGMKEWSLGINSGTISADGRTLTGFGTDKWGTYEWNASIDR